MATKMARVLAVAGVVAGFVSAGATTTPAAADASTVVSSTAEVTADARAAAPGDDRTDNEGHDAAPFAGTDDEAVSAHEGPVMDPTSGKSATSDSGSQFSTGITTGNAGELLTISSTGDTTNSMAASTDGTTVAGGGADSALDVHFSVDAPDGVPVLLTGTLAATGTGQNKCGDFAEIDLTRKVPGPNNDVEVLHERVAATHLPGLCGNFPNSGTSANLHLVALLPPAQD